MSYMESFIQAKNVMGGAGLAYVLNLSLDEIDRILKGETHLNQQQEQVLADLNTILTKIRIEAMNQNDPASYIHFCLSNLASSSEGNNFNLLREKAGAVIINPAPEDDDVLNSLTALALETYPALLIPSSDKFDIIKTFMAAMVPFQHQENENFTAAVLRDSKLSKLFPRGCYGATMSTCSVLSSTGRGGTFQIEILASTLVRSAYVLMRMQNELSPESLIKCLHEIVSILRRVTVGEKVRVPAFLGFNHVGVPQRYQQVLTFGIMRDVREGDLEMIPDQLKPDGRSGQEKLGLVLETDFPYEIIIGDSPAFGPWPDSFTSKITKANEEMNKKSEQLSMLLSLGVEREPPVGVVRAWTLIIDPLAHGPNISWSNFRNPFVPSYVINGTDNASLKEWDKLMNTVDDRHIRIAIRRILSAVSHRDNPVDGFIDTIVAWENLFGSQTEVTFQISASMAKLISNDTKERLRLQQLIAKQYGIRSKIIHGDLELSATQATKERDEALSRILICLRLLYKNRPDLIKDTNRAKTILLT